MSAVARKERTCADHSDRENLSTEEAFESPKTTIPSFPETNLSDGIIGWNGQDDPDNPQNFSASRKWSLVGLISVFTFISPLASSMFAPAVEFMASDFNVTSEAALSFTVSVYLLGYTFGPLLLAPLSEIYGRRVILGSANCFFVFWQIGCALAQNIQTLIVCRFLAGIGGSACITLGPAIVTDLFPRDKRGMAISIWGTGFLVGPIVGPIAGGFLGERAGWRWIFWVLTISSAVTAIANEIFNKETYPAVLIRRKKAKLARELARSDLRHAYELEKRPVSLGQTLKQSLQRPILLLLKSPIIFLLSLYMALIYGLLYLFFTTITDVFTTQYGLSVGLSGLAYLGIGVGFFVGLAVIANTNDRIVIKLTARNDGQFQPEMRLPMMIFFACILPISFFWYGWTAEKHVSSIVPIIGMFPFGFAMMGIFLPIQTYVVDCYPVYAASANAALMATRSLVGALLPLAGPAMFHSLGLGWGNSLLGFVAIVFIPVPIIFTRYGRTIREKWPVNLENTKT